MLGYTQSNNDIYIFFEENEIEKLEQKKIQGTYFNFNNLEIIGLLEVSIDNKISDRMITSVNKNDSGFITWLHLKMKTSEYYSLKEQKSRELHEGFRHICLRDSSNLDNLNMNDRFNFRQLKYYESKINKN
ncbi:MAG: hypothetical protein Q7S33_01825 [Nanoarchaeota archaeon]|nr:hypothetical protein [Nanoarchaeota archaeon]